MEQNLSDNDANLIRNGANSNPGLSSSDAKSKDVSPMPGDDVSYKLENEWEQGDELNPFLEAETKNDDDAPSGGETKESIPSLKDELEAAGVGLYVQSETNGFHTKEEEDIDVDDRTEEKSGTKEEEQEKERYMKDEWRVKDSEMDQGQNVQESVEESKGGDKEQEFTSSYGNSLGAFRGWSSEFPTNKPSPVMTEDAPDSYIRQGIKKFLYSVVCWLICDQFYFCKS